MQYDNKGREFFHRNLTMDEVKDIRDRYINGETQTKLANEYGVHIKMIYNIVHLKSYRHIEVDDDYLEKLKQR